ncbi:MAG: pyridoxamine 5'-phosphate oxidase [Gemmataceae bacterium]
MTLAELREEYTHAGLTEADAGNDPFALFVKWFDQAIAAGVPEPNAMTLATATPEGRPSARILLLKGCDERGFTFFTNYDSRKGQDLATNPRAALVFHWVDLARQVRIEGSVSRISEMESDQYHASRPRGSRLGAWASPQSRVIPDRSFLESKLPDLEARYPTEIPRPPYWGGFRVVPETIEFWQGRPNRLHDRLRFTRRGDAWVRERLGP